jgi:Flp pilus assembly protein TadG
MKRFLNLLSRLKTENRGVAAIEFAIIAPVFIGLIGFGVNAGQLQQQALSAQYLSAAGAMAAKASGSTDPAVIEPLVTSLLNANAVFLTTGTTMTIGFAYPSGFAAQVTVGLSSPALWPLFIDTIAVTRSAQQ